MKPKRKQPAKEPNPRPLQNEAEIIGGRRFQTKVTPAIKAIASRFPGNGPATIKQVAEFVFDATPLKQTVWNKGKRYSRTATDTLKEEKVDLLHCYDRSHLLISILAAKKIPAWMVVSMDYRKFVHSFVETRLGGKIYTIAFKLWEKPIFAEGPCEKAIAHAPGTSFLRGVELADFGVKDTPSFENFVQQMLAGKAKDRIKFGWSQA